MATSGRRAHPPKVRLTGWPVSIDVEGLFGDEGIERHIDLRSRERVTILTGPNGSGKTRLLSMLRAALAFDWSALAREPFSMLQIGFSSGRVLTAQRRADFEEVIFEISVRQGRTVRAQCTARLLTDPTAHLAMPAYIQRLDEDTWEDSRDGELLDLEDLNSRFGGPGRMREAQHGFRVVDQQPPNGLATVRGVLGRCPNPTFVKTQRLDVEQRPRLRPGMRRPRGHSRIFEYVDEIQTQVESARADYSRIAQLRDSQFASRALDTSGDDPPLPPELRSQFDELAELHRELLSTGLVAETPGVEMGGGRLTKPERRFLAVFLDDWRSKLQPLLPVHEKLQMLQEIVGKKLDRKSLRLDESARLRIEAKDGSVIALDQLSSGEQHLLALFAMLLFNANPESVVLIDEPEISLHAEWKHAFLDDIRRVAETADLHVVIATHSTGIINGQWELVEQL